MTELQELERRLAEKEAKRVVRGLCDCFVDGWCDTQANFTYKDERRAIRYLDQRSLLERKPDAPHIVRVKEPENDE